VTNWVEVADHLADELAPSVSELDREGTFAVDHVELLAKAGYLTMCLPAPTGTDADLRAVCRAQTALARGCASTALAVNMHLFATGSRAEGARAGVEGHQPLLDRVGAGAIVGGTFTDTLARDGATPVVARPIDSGYVVTGRRAFCSLAPVLDLYYGTARVGPSEASDPSDPSDATIAFWLPRSTRGLSFENTWDTMSMRGSGSWDVVFDDVFVPHLMAAQLGARGGWDRDAERTLAWFVCTIVAVYLGIADAAVACTVDQLRRRPSSRPLSIVETNRLGDAVVAVATARALLDEMLTRRTSSVPTEAALAMMKSVATNQCIAAVDGCVDLVGGAALYRRLPLERLYRDVRAARMHPPSDDRARALAAEELLAAPTSTDPADPTTDDDPSAAEKAIP